MSEWLKEPASKTGVRFPVPGVRIPFPPQIGTERGNRATLDCLFLFSICNARRRRAGMSEGLRPDEIPEGKGFSTPHLLFSN